MGHLADHHGHIETKAQVDKLEEGLRREENVQPSTSLPASGLADKVGEQNNKLEEIVCRSAGLRGHKLSCIKSQVL